MPKITNRTPIVIAALLGAVAFTGAGSSSAAPSANGSDHGSHDLSHPLGAKRRAQRAEAMRQIMGGAPVYGKTHEVANGQFVELERQAEDPIWTVLGDFGAAPSPYFGGAPGPQHNQISEPSRSIDNTTHWRADFNQEHYQEMLFSGEEGANSMRNFYIEQSSGRYAVYGDVEDWVTVPYNATHYGSNWCGGTVCYTTWWFVQDTLNAWYQSKLAAGMTPEQVDDYLAQFDKWDRYDYDGDGNFDEPDGYIDHFQAIHAGEGEEAGGGAQGSDAIWSHRWYVQLTPIYAGGPTLPDGTVVPFGGVQIGGSRFWVGDYTVEPENGGVGVFAHEFAHDLGLPDLYDTAGGDNSTAFWTLMSGGSWMGAGEDDIGTAPVHMGAWEKLQLGWLNYEVANADVHSTHKIGPAEANTKQAQALIVLLPDKELTTNISEPYEGEHFYYSGAGNGLDNSMTRMFDVGPGSTLTAQVNFDIEQDWDYAYAIAFSPDHGLVNLATNHSSSDDPFGQNFGEGITGSSGGWTELTADLGSLPPGQWSIGFRYWTDGYVTNPGFMVDALEVTGYAFDGAETDAGWTFAGFSTTTGSETTHHFNAYIAEYRQHVSWDDGLRTGPYNFGFLNDPEGGSNWVEHFSYQEGLLVNYWDGSQLDNNTSQHPGAGLILPIDAHPGVLYRADGTPDRSRVQAYDSTFGLQDTDALTLHWFGVPVTHPSLPAANVFDDNNQYYNPATPLAGVANPHTDTQIWINSVSAQGSFMQVQVN